MNERCLVIHGIKKEYQGMLLLNSIDLDLYEKETLCLLGPSGSGKSTFLRILAGLENADEGSILWKGEDISSLPAEKRNFGLMFQDYALFPHLSVAENVAFGLRMRRWSTEAIRERVEQTLKIVHMEGFSGRRVVDLSGGEKQRVALARTIAPKPALLMLDEPLGALDKALRDELGQVLRGILKDLHTPTIYVTHDQEEAFTLGDRVAVLNFGKILQLGKPEEIYAHPSSLWLAGFLGFKNKLLAKVVAVNPLKLATSLGEFILPNLNEAFATYQENGELILVIRPDGASIAEDSMSTNQVKGIVVDSQFCGEGYRLVLKMEDGSIFYFNDTQRREIGTVLNLKVLPTTLLVYLSHE